MANTIWDVSRIPSGLTKNYCNQTPHYVDGRGYLYDNQERNLYGPTPPPLLESDVISNVGDDFKDALDRWYVDIFSAARKIYTDKEIQEIEERAQAEYDFAFQSRNPLNNARLARESYIMLASSRIRRAFVKRNQDLDTVAKLVMDDLLGAARCYSMFLPETLEQLRRVNSMSTLLVDRLIIEEMNIAPATDIDSRIDKEGERLGVLASNSRVLIDTMLGQYRKLGLQKITATIKAASGGCANSCPVRYRSY